MKLRFSSLDVRVTAHELSQILVGMRLQNIYDLSTKIFLFKFQKSTPTTTRAHVILDSGFRIHTTSFSRATAGEPSPFVRRLRKILGTRRVTSVRQIGTDRIIEIAFSDGQFKLYFEFYASGNVIATDKDQKVLAVQRTVDDSENESAKVGGLYTLEGRQNINGLRPVDVQRVKTMLEKFVESSAKESKDETGVQPAPKFKARKGASQLKRAIGTEFSEFPAVLVDHSILKEEFDGSLTPEEILNNDELLNKFTKVLQSAQGILEDVGTSEKHKSYIISKRRKDGAAQGSNQDAEASEAKFIYDDYHPFKPQQFEDKPEIKFLEFNGFNAAVDEFYSSIEGQKLDSRLADREHNAKKKLDESKRQHQERLGHLQQSQQVNIRKAEAIQANLERVEEAVAAVNGLIAQGMDWVDISRLIEAEQTKANPVARLIKLPLKLYENTVTLILAEADGNDDDQDSKTMSDTDEESSDSDQEPPPTRARNAPSRPQQDNRLTIDINLSLSAWANASQYYDQKKAAAEKHDRTEQISTLALRNAERKITIDLKKGLSKEKEILRPLRQAFWFEKFYHFVSTDGYLVLAGKDPSQAEMVYKRYFKPGDVFVHADIPGAAVTIIKNNDINSLIPPSTLSQAGNFAVVASSAWDSKALMAAWWVKFEQVSKISAAGDDLMPLGKFEIRGEKQYLPPAQLLVGIGILFGISEESSKNHSRNRFTGGDAVTNLEDFESADAEAIHDADMAAEEQGDQDSDEDFPDAAAPVPSYDSDEDFPDANPTAKIDSDDETLLPARNPLQSQSLAKSPVQPKDVPSTSKAPVGVSDSASSHRHISAKQRRLFKKGLGSTTTMNKQGDNNDLENDSDSDATTMTATTLNTLAAANRNSPLPRGKRNKVKKAKLKYAEQDEDDRAAALARLGSQLGIERREAEVKEQMAKIQQEEFEREKLRRKKEENQKRLEEERQRQAAAALASSSAAAAPVEDVQDGDGMEEADLSLVSRLTRKPHPADEILFALPICAPWTSLANYKYKVKLQPGPVKKGKAAREILARWHAAGKIPKNIDSKAHDAERMWPREVELIQGFKDTELIANMVVSKVKILMAGGSSGGGKGDAKGKAKGGGGGGRGRKN